jgi:hypothetical protein
MEDSSKGYRAKQKRPWGPAYPSFILVHSKHKCLRTRAISRATTSEPFSHDALNGRGMLQDCLIEGNVIRHQSEAVPRVQGASSASREPET